MKNIQILFITIALYGFFFNNIIHSQNKINVWTGIIHATPSNNYMLDNNLPNSVKIALGQKRNKNFKPFRKFIILSSESNTIGVHTQSIIKPSNKFYFKVKYKGKSNIPNIGVGRLIELKIFQNNKLILVIESSISPKKPIIIGGPNFRNGKILFIVNILSS